MSPTQGPNQKWRCDPNGGRDDEPQECGENPPPSGNWSPFVVAISLWEAPDSVVKCLLNKEQVAEISSHDLYNTREDHWNN